MRRLRGDESGVALVIALAFLSLFGVFVAVLLSQADTHLKTTQAVRSVQAKLYAADGGIEYGVQTLRSNASFCPNVAAGKMDLPDVVINGRTVKVTCEAKEGFISDFGDPNSYAVITTDTGPNSISTQSGQQGVKIQGSTVFVAGGMDLKSTLTIVGGDVLQKSAAPCPGSLTQPSNLVVNSPHSWQCTNAATPDPSHALPANPPATVDPPHTDLAFGRCRIFDPGTYTTAPTLRGPNPGGWVNYFRSGVYYFEDIGELDIGQNKVVIGGHPSAGEVRQFPTNACAADAIPGGNGYGVRFVLGGDSRITVDNGTMELFSRVPSGSEGTSGISLHMVESGAPAGWLPWGSGSNDGFDSANPNAQVAVHGFVYGPTAPMSIFASQPTTAQVRRGLIAHRLHLQASNSGTDNLVISRPSSFRVTRYVRIVAEALGTGPSEGSTKVRAIVTIENDQPATYPTTLASWRRV